MEVLTGIFYAPGMNVYILSVGLSVFNFDLHGEFEL